MGNLFNLLFYIMKQKQYDTDEMNFDNAVKSKRIKEKIKTLSTKL